MKIDFLLHDERYFLDTEKGTLLSSKGDTSLGETILREYNRPRAGYGGGYTPFEEISLTEPLKDPRRLTAALICLGYELPKELHPYAPRWRPRVDGVKPLNPWTATEEEMKRWDEEHQEIREIEKMFNIVY